MKKDSLKTAERFLKKKYGNLKELWSLENDGVVLKIVQFKEAKYRDNRILFKNPITKRTTIFGYYNDKEFEKNFNS